MDRALTLISIDRKIIVTKEVKGEVGLLRTRPQIFLLYDIDININTGRILLERKVEVGLLRTSPQIFLLCDIDNNINTGRIWLQRKGRERLAFYGQNHRCLCSVTVIQIYRKISVRKERRGWPFRDKTTDVLFCDIDTNMQEGFV